MYRFLLVFLLHSLILYRLAYIKKAKGKNASKWIRKKNATPQNRLARAFQFTEWFSLYFWNSLYRIFYARFVHLCKCNDFVQMVFGCDATAMTTTMPERLQIKWPFCLYALQMRLAETKRTRESETEIDRKATF